MGDARDVAERPSYDELVGLVGELRAQIAGFQAQVVGFQAQIAGLEARLAGNSRNSSRPPSSDGLSKAPADSKAGRKRSLRRSTGRSQGGQQGHQGSRLERAAVPDRVVEHPPGCCDGCGGDLAGGEVVAGGESRQVFDAPEQPDLDVVEHVAQLRRCGCGHVSAGEFPHGVDAPTQYGPRLRALGVYLVVFQHLPYDRARQALRDLAGGDVSTATLVAWVSAAAGGLCDFDERLRELLVCSPVAHFDETGARIAGRLNWVHSASTETLTRYTTHPKRGNKAIDHAAVLPDFKGVAVHDGWASYRKYQDCEHALCNVHHLRELQAAEEAGHTWPLAMSALLLDTKDLVAKILADDRHELPNSALRDLAKSYSTIIEMGHAEHPQVTEGKRTKAHNLLLRLELREADVLRFAHNFNVPFGNNQAEQDIRMVKLQQKISGCWRSPAGAQRFLAVRGYLSTTRKNGIAAIDALNALMTGAPWMPASAPT